jgi:creatinine amidohydrolase
VMLALHPDKVDTTKASDFPSRQRDFAGRFKHLRAYGPHAFGWKMRDLNADGVAGNASAATAARGEALLAHAVKGLVELLEDVRDFDPSELA